jgi:hypothetical protein
LAIQHIACPFSGLVQCLQSGHSEFISVEIEKGNDAVEEYVDSLQNNLLIFNSKKYMSKK